jgi:hypothetical protein
MATSFPQSETVAERLHREGWVSTPSLIQAEVLDTLTRDLSPLLDEGSVRGGTRQLLDLAVVQDLARSKAVRSIAEEALGPRCFAVRGILFDKTPSANWKVTWHQDLTIAVREHRDAAGFGPWSVKERVPHVQPPVAILERMIAVRVHLDECGVENGPVRVIPRSHISGRLSGEDIDRWKEEHAAVNCTVLRGGILAFFPLLLHSSSPATRPGHRRVVHLEFAAANLPSGLEWYHSIGESDLALSA